MVPVRVSHLLQLGAEKGWMVVLLDEDGGRALPIHVGAFEGLSIAVAATGTTQPRPLAHDLLVRLVEQLGGSVERLAVHDLRDTTFIGQLDVASPLGVLEVDCRPSDGIAVAVRVGCPILVDERVMDDAAVDSDQVGDGPPDEPPTWD